MLSMHWLDRLRTTELDVVVPELRPKARVLEFGAGTGGQAQRLGELGFDVLAVDLPSSAYAGSRVFPVIDYDGETIPLADRSVDIVFSSNVLEHVANFARIAQEIRRITRPGGYGVHIVPSAAWRMWTIASGPPNAALVAADAARHLVSGPSRAAALRKDAKLLAGSLLPIGHGTAFEGLSELWTFSAAAWRRRFRRHGFVVERHRPIGVFYTGHSLFGARVSIERRRKLAPWLGSAANVFVVRPA
jgi:SAM-dependent methyltransferase